MAEGENQNENHQNRPDSEQPPGSRESRFARFGSISRHPIISSTVAGVMTAALLWAFNLDGGESATDDTSSTSGAANAVTTESVEASSESSTATSSPTTVPANTTTTLESLLLVSATRDMDFYGDGWTVALPDPFPDDPSQRPQGTDIFSEEVLDWALEQNAEFTYSALEIVIEGSSSSTVTITGAHASVLERKEPNPAAYLTSESAGAGAVIGWYFDLNDPSPTALALTEDDFSPDPADLQPFFADQVITVAPGEVVVLHVEASAESCDCTWTIELDAVVGGDRHSITVDREGEPFRTVSWSENSRHFGFAWWEPDTAFVEYADDGSYIPLP